MKKKTVKKEKRADLIVSLEGDRLYLRATGNHAVSIKIDVTPLWNFFNEVVSLPITNKKK